MLEKLHLQRCSETGVYLQDANETPFYLRSWTLPKSEAKKVVADIIFCHGLGEHVSRYNDVFSRFVQQGIQVHGFDWRGHGRTLVQPRHEEISKTRQVGMIGHIAAEGLEAELSVVKDIKWVLTTVKEFRAWNYSYNGTNGHTFPPKFLMGHSMGGFIALHYMNVTANDDGFAGVILSAPCIAPAVPIPALKYHAGIFMANFFGTLAIPNDLDAKDITRNEEEVRKYNEDPLVHGKISLATASFMLKRCEDLRQHAASRINFPLLIAHGSGDKMTSFEASKEFCEGVERPDCKFIEYDGFYHELHNEPEADRALVIKNYIDWIKEIAASAE